MAERHHPTPIAHVPLAVELGRFPEGGLVVSCVALLARSPSV